MKKRIITLLAIFLLAGLLAVPVSATTPTATPLPSRRSGINQMLHNRPENEERYEFMLWITGR